MPILARWQQSSEKQRMGARSQQARRIARVLPTCHVNTKCLYIGLSAIKTYQSEVIYPDGEIVRPASNRGADATGELGAMRCRSFLLGTIASLVSMHAAFAAERIHIDFNGYRPATNDYCIGARSVQGDSMFGFLWRFSAGGGPSTVTGAPTVINLLKTSSTEVFPASISDREKFRVFGNPLGPLIGAKSISNELNARRDQTCQSGGGGGGTGLLPGLPVLPPGVAVNPLLPVRLRASRQPLTARPASGRRHPLNPLTARRRRHGRRRRRHGRRRRWHGRRRRWQRRWRRRVWWWSRQRAGSAPAVGPYTRNGLRIAR